MRLTSTHLLGFVLTIAMTALATAPVAFAGDGLTNEVDGVEAHAGRQSVEPAHHQADHRRAVQAGVSSGDSKYTYLPKPKYKTQMDAYKQKLSAAIAANRATTNAQGQCLSGPQGLACGRFQQVALPTAPNIRQAGKAAAVAAAPAAPALSPEQVAYIASARIRLTPPKPMIGPPPGINEWKMAAVGYPLWLWAEGNLDPAPVSDSVMDIAVSLDAHLVKVVFDMGDGHKVSCSTPATKWNRSVEPGAKSPSCGYAYPKPSLPKGSYTVTAHAVWAIGWNINGTTGTIPFFQSASTQIPVGELQVLVR
jgi:hypothetical protein